MKNLLLLISLFIIGTASLKAEENTQAGQTATQSEASAPQMASAVAGGGASGLGDSFMAAFGMSGSAAGDTGEGAPGAGGASSSAGSMAAGMAAITTSATNQVTPPFTPYSYTK